MIETGHFQELENIFKITNRAIESCVRLGSNYGSDIKYQLGDREATDDDLVDDPIFKALEARNSEPNDELQTLIFSATLSKDLQRNLRRRQKGNVKHKKNNKKAISTLGSEYIRRLQSVVRTLMLYHSR